MNTFAKLKRLCIAAAIMSTTLFAHAVDIQMPSGVLKLDMPKGYTELSADEIDSKFGRNGRKPVKAFGNKSRASTVSVTFSPVKHPLTQDTLPELKETMEGMLPKLTPGLVFNDKKMVTVGERQWIFLDSTVPAIDTKVRNQMYLTDLNGNMVGVNFNSTVEEFKSQAKAFSASAKTLKAQ